MTAPAERMKMMRQRRRARGLRELRLVVADARSRAVRRRVVKQVAGLDPDREREALLIRRTAVMPQSAHTLQSTSMRRPAILHHASWPLRYRNVGRRAMVSGSTQGIVER
jgi:hypothetical protein